MGGGADESWAAWLTDRMRRRRMLSNRDLSRASGVSDSVISRWRADGVAPTLPQLRRLVEPLGVELLDLLVAAGHLTAAERSPGSAPVSDVESAVQRAGLDPDLSALLITHWRSAQQVQRARARHQELLAERPPLARPGSPEPHRRRFACWGFAGTQENALPACPAGYSRTARDAPMGMSEDCSH